MFLAASQHLDMVNGLLPWVWKCSANHNQKVGKTNSVRAGLQTIQAQETPCSSSRLGDHRIAFRWTSAWHVWYLWKLRGLGHDSKMKFSRGSSAWVPNTFPTVKLRRLWRLKFTPRSKEAKIQIMAQVEMVSGRLSLEWVICELRLKLRFLMVSEVKNGLLWNCFGAVWLKRGSCKWRTCEARKQSSKSAFAHHFRKKQGQCHYCCKRFKRLHWVLWINCWESGQTNVHLWIITHQHNS